MGKKVFSFLFFCMTFLLLSGIALANDASYLYPGSVYSNTLTSSGDKHMYRIDTTVDNGDVSIYLSNSSAPVRFAIYDSDNKRLDYSISNYFNTLKAGTYYIEVSPYRWGNQFSSGSYDIIATYASGDIPQDEKSHEPNDTRENAYSINSGEKISSSISNDLDRDFYEFTTSADNGDVYIYLSNTTAPVRFAVYDSNKNRLDYSLNSYSARLKAGTYYIQVHSYRWGNNYSSGDYDIIATYSTPSVNHDSKTLEPNDTRENAVYINSGGTVNSTLSSEMDIDYYEISLTKAGNVNLYLSDTSAPARFAIYDSKKNRIDYAITSYSRQLEPGTYYIQVYPYRWNNQYSSGTYVFNASYPGVSSGSNEILLYLDSKTAIVNNKSKQLDVAPFLKDGTTLVPLRFVSEEFGADVKWDAANQAITVLLDGTKVELTIGSQNVKVNGKSSKIQVAPEIINSTTFVPLRFVSEQLGKEVLWNQANKSITIK